MTTTPTQNIRLRPKRLPGVPADSTRLATTSVCVLVIQINALGLTYPSFPEDVVGVGCWAHRRGAPGPCAVGRYACWSMRPA
ncbi:hypothetical protein [Streptomyces humidus]|uniref:hypothetical protein n=1 Tax=Streptomyces humidus TaxID=52259 RepID=UPI003324DC8F